MIDKSIEKLAHERALELESQGIFAVARVGTPLERLVSDLLPGADTGSLYASDAFTASLTGMADDLADNVRNYLNFARNAAKPALEEIEDKVRSAIGEITIDPLAGLNIVEVQLPGLMADPDFMNKVNQSDVSWVAPKQALRFGERTDTQLLELCDTGIAAWDNEFRSWIKTQPEGTLQTVWQSIFMDPTFPSSVATRKSAEDLMGDYVEGKCSALVAYLMASRLYQNIGEDCGVTLDVARAILFARIAQGAGSVLRAVQWYNSFVLTNTMIVDFNRLQRNIRVNAQMYNEFVAAGGRPEVLLAVLISESKYRTMAELKEHSEELLAEWNHYVLARTETSAAEYELKVRTAMELCFMAALDGASNEIEAGQLATPGVRENILRIFNEELRAVSREQINENWVDVLWRVSAKARYYYFTFVYELLDAIEYNVRVNKLDADGAARIATQKIVSQYVNEQMMRA